MAYKTKSELKDEILEVLEDADEAMTATAISKELGYSKLRSRVADALAELVTDGDVETGVKGSHTTYSLSDEECDDEEEVQEEETDIPIVEITEVTVPENLHGYEVVGLEKGHNKVIIPGANGAEPQEVILEPNERLLVISDTYKYVVSQPEHVIEAINEYTSEQGITTYLVTDMSTGRKAQDVTDINMDVVIIFLQISRHNKAGK